MVIEDANLRLQLVPLDVLQALGVSADDDEQSAVATPLTATVSGPPANIIVASSTPGPDGVVADDIALRLAASHRIDVARRMQRADATGSAGEIVEIDLEDDTTESLLVLGMGDGGVAAAREAGAKLAPRLGGADVVLCDVTATLSRASLESFCEGLLLASYHFSRKSEQPESSTTVVQLVVPSVATVQAVLTRAQAVSQAVFLARDLANAPSNEKNPTTLADQSRQLAKRAKLRYRVIDAAGLERGGFGGLLAVGGGSVQPPNLIVLEHRGEIAAPRVVLVGKGITFDSGGLSIKPPEGMPLMKTDMSGAAAVLGVMSALAELKVTTNVVALLACAENMPSGSAYRPGDVVRHYGGQTSEVRNTDAEGRMVLADALAYAAARLHPDAIIDVATLTGAATLGLSRVFGALYSADDGLTLALERAADESNDRLWRMPLVNEYRSSLDSPIADISHVSDGSVGGGSITAALFLREFTAGKRWAHLDIAGPARAEAARAELTRGATGYGVRLLLRWLSNAPNLW